MATKTIQCNQHGERHVTLVCQHIAQGLFHGEPVGFFWSHEDKTHWPDAWCNECNERLQLTDGEWEGASLQHLGAQVLCSDCYDQAARLNFETVEWRAAFPDSFTEIPSE